MQRRWLKLISVKEAVEREYEAVSSIILGSETLPVEQAMGRVLYCDIVADHDVPNRNRAAMDGYAVSSKAAPTRSGSRYVRLKLIGRMFPDDSPELFRISADDAVYVSCGAPLPEGADSVVRVEDARLVGDEIEIPVSVEQWMNVSYIGEDAVKGELILQKGRVLRPQDIEAFFALSKSGVEVYRRPKVAIISVGDELSDLKNYDVDLDEGIPNTHAYMVSALLSKYGAIPLILDIARDDPEDIGKMVLEGVEKADMIITIAGCSVGLRDFVPDVVNSVNQSQPLFHGVKLSAGKVSGCSIIRGKLLVMLPGHTVSTFAGFYIFVMPILNILSGLPADSRPPRIVAKSLSEVKGKLGIESFLLLNIWREGLQYLATPLPSHVTVTKNLARANGFTVIGAGETVKEGDHVIASLVDVL